MENKTKNISKKGLRNRRRNNNFIELYCMMRLVMLYFHSLPQYFTLYHEIPSFGLYEPEREILENLVG